MKQIVKESFPSFNQILLDEIEKNAVVKEFKAGEILIRSGQYIKNTVLVLKGKIKIYREDEDGNEFFMYYLQPGQACAISMVCAAEHKKSAIMAKAVKDTEIIAIP